VTCKKRAFIKLTLVKELTSCVFCTKEIIIAHESVRTPLKPEKTSIFFSLSDQVLQNIVHFSFSTTNRRLDATLRGHTTIRNQNSFYLFFF